MGEGKIPTATDTKGCITLAAEPGAMALSAGTVSTIYPIVPPLPTPAR